MSGEAPGSWMEVAHPPLLTSATGACLDQNFEALTTSSTNHADEGRQTSHWATLRICRNLTKLAPKIHESGEEMTKVATCG